MRILLETSALQLFWNKIVTAELDLNSSIEIYHKVERQFYALIVNKEEIRCLKQIFDSFFQVQFFSIRQNIISIIL